MKARCAKKREQQLDDEDADEEPWWRMVWRTALPRLVMQVRTVEALLATEVLMSSGQRREVAELLTGDDVAVHVVDVRKKRRMQSVVVHMPVSVCVRA